MNKEQISALIDKLLDEKLEPISKQITIIQKSLNNIQQSLNQEGNRLKPKFVKEVEEPTTKIRTEKREDLNHNALIEETVQSDAKSPKEFSWPTVLKKINIAISNPSFETWFAKTSAEIKDDVLNVLAGNEFVKDWLEERYQTLIEDSVWEVTGKKYKIQFLLDNKGNDNNEI
jgi:superfamily II RNA helicase